MWLYAYVVVARGLFEREKPNCEHHSERGSLMNLGEAISLLQSDPATFIKTEYLIIAGGGSTHIAGDTICKMEPRSGTGGGWRVTVREQNNARALATDEFRAWYIPMQQVGTMQANRLPDATTSPITLMVTSQLTACIFGVGRDAGGTIVAHIQPDQGGHMGIADAKMREQFRQSDARMKARTAGMGPLMAKYRDEGYGEFESVTVLGKRDTHGQWVILAQKHHHSAHTISGLATM